jgi:hypothetical protein
VARDNTCSVLDIAAGFIQRVASALHAKALAALHGLSRAVQLRMTRIQLEKIASNLGKTLTTECLDSSSEGALFRQIRIMIANNFVSCSISTYRGSCNRVADCLPNHGVVASPDGGHILWCQAPSLVTELVSSHLPGAGGQQSSLRLCLDTIQILNFYTISITSNLCTHT